MLAERHAERRTGVVREGEAHEFAHDGMWDVLGLEITNRKNFRDDVEGDDQPSRRPKRSAVCVFRAHVACDYDSSRGSPVTVAAAGTGTRSVSVSSPQSTHASRKAPRLTAMSAMLNVGHRESPSPMSMKSTTPRGARTRSMRLPTAPPHTSASDIVRVMSPPRVAT